MPLLSDRAASVPARVLAVAAGTAAAAGLGFAVHAAARKLRAEQPPREWRRVGQITGLDLFPLKSGKATPAESLRCDASGPSAGQLRDRSFVGVDRNGRFISGRTHPRLLHIEVSRSADGNFELHSAYLESRHVLDVSKFGEHVLKISVQNCPVSAVDCGDEAAAWFRRAVVEPSVHREATAEADLRLVYFPFKKTDRGGDENFVPRAARGIFSDATSYHIVTKSSVTALNEKLANPVQARNFRPNFIVDGPQAFEEDNWSWVRIGEKAVFNVAMPCGRCIMTTIDPETGMKSADMEPLKTLKTFRKPNEAQKKKMQSDTPMMGLMLGIVECGEVTIGDSVYIAA